MLPSLSTGGWVAPNDLQWLLYFKGLWLLWKGTQELSPRPVPPWSCPGLVGTVSIADMPIHQSAAGLRYPPPQPCLEKHSRTDSPSPFLLYLPVGLSACCRPLPRVLKAELLPVFMLRPLSSSKRSLIYKPREVPGQQRLGTLLSSVICVWTCQGWLARLSFQVLPRLSHPLLTVAPCLHHFFHG